MRDGSDAALERVAECDRDGWMTFVVPPSMMAARWIFCAFGLASIAISMASIMGWFWALPWEAVCAWAAIYYVRLGYREWKSCLHDVGPAIERIHPSSD